MGDKSPKSVKKQASQKIVKSNNDDKKKRELIASKQVNGAKKK